MFGSTYETRYGDYKDFDYIKTGTILDIVQDVSIKHSNSCGYGMHHMRDIGLAWLMQGIKLKIVKKPNVFDNIVAYTGVRKINGVSSERGCILEQNGEIIAKTIACWFLIDIEKGVLSRIPDEMANAYDIHDFKDDFFVYKKLRVNSVGEEKYTVRISNHEIDTNGHLNNEKAFEILADTLPYDYDYDTVELLYKKESYLGDEMKICVDKTEKGYCVELVNSNMEVCVAGVFTKE